MNAQRLNFLIYLFFPPTPSAASGCHNITNVRWGTNDATQYSNTNVVPLESVSCPPNATVPSSALPKCEVSRRVYEIIVPRLINVTNLSSEDENAVFERARLGYWMSGSQKDNESAWDDEWVSRPRTLDTTEYGPEGRSDSVFETSAAYNYTVSFLSYDRWVHGILDGCDNQALNGMGISIRAPYLVADTSRNSELVVAGQVVGFGINTTRAEENKDRDEDKEKGESAASSVIGFSSALYVVSGITILIMWL